MTPGKGTLELSKDDPDPTFFHLVRVGLGCFGIVTEVTLQCVADHKLIEKSFVATFADVKKHHTKSIACAIELEHFFGLDGLKRIVI